jgi:hypothetical protein
MLGRHLDLGSQAGALRAASERLISQESLLKQWTRLSLLAQAQRLSAAFPAGNRRFPAVGNKPPVPRRLVMLIFYKSNRTIYGYRNQWRPRQSFA